MTDKHTTPEPSKVYINGEPFEGIGDAELEPVHPDDMPQAVNTAELTLTFTPEQAAAVVKAITEAIDKAAKALQWIAEAVKRAAEIAGEKAAKFIEAELYYANDNPRWWHLYKHAKKARTRKKYRRRLMKQLLSKLKATAPAQEVNT